MKPPRRFLLSPGLATTLVLAARFFLGVALGLLLHYLMYRMSLPGTPFIYVAF